MTNGVTRELPNCSSQYLSVLCDISSSICSNIVSDYLLSCNPLNPETDRRGADLYSSRSPHNVTGRKERRSEWARICEHICARDIYLRVYVRVQVCTSLYVWGSLPPLLHTPTLPKLISLFMREASSKRRQMKT